MAEISHPWKGRDVAPQHNQLIIAAIGERGSSEEPSYIIARFREEGDYRYLSYPLFVGNRREEKIDLMYLRAWQPLEIQKPATP